MLEVAGRPILGALHMLLSAERVFSGPVPERHRLPALLRDSRRYQNEVSTKLAGQVLAALHELLRGFQAADDASKGELLREVLQRAPQDVYGGLLGTLMRLVFVLYAEERELLPSRNEVYAEHYSVTGLFARLRDDNARYPDTMDQRYGAWARLLTLFRLIHDGASHGGLRLPARHGRLFDPDTWDFLEGRAYGDQLDRSRRIDPPRVPDGVVYRVLDNLLVLDGERISYRALDVEQIGSVYEAMMGFELRVAQGPSIGVKPDHVVVDLADLLAAKPADRLKRLKEEASCDLSGAAGETLKAATTPDDAVAALGKKASPHTPRIVPKGAMFLQPTDERRRSGSHYTPRSLTEPIVRTTLDPILKNLGDSPKADQILDLKVCDPAMGSGAFLVEACRYLGDALVKAWETHGDKPQVPPDEDPLLYARRLVAQRCLYGVDKNPYAVDLAKLSLWLATLARDHPFTFLDHALRHGDSLVGLSREQISSFSWEPKQKHLLISGVLERNLKLAEESRAEAAGPRRHGRPRGQGQAPRGQRAGDPPRPHGRRPRHRRLLRRGEGQAARGPPQEERGPAGPRAGRRRAADSDLDAETAPLYQGPRPLHPFHWPVEFPEVFSRHEPRVRRVRREPAVPRRNVDWIETRPSSARLPNVGVRASNWFGGPGSVLPAACVRPASRRWRSRLHRHKHRRAGRHTQHGLEPIVRRGGAIFEAIRRYRWPGQAAVVASVVHILKRPVTVARLEWRGHRISSFLLSGSADGAPALLHENSGVCYLGAKVWGAGFVFEPEPTGGSSSIIEMERLIAECPRNREVVFPYVGGEEFNDSPAQTPRRHVIDFGRMSLAQAQEWPTLLAIIEEGASASGTQRAVRWTPFFGPERGAG